MASSNKIELYTFAVPNGIKVAIALEEMGLEYNTHIINLSLKEQLSPEYIAINPNAKVPAITDPDGPDGEPFTISESGAILMYLAEKTGKFLPSDPRLRWETIQWVFFSMSGIGPMFREFGQYLRFAAEKCKDPYPLERYTTESRRLLGLLDNKLQGQDFILGNEYTIADIDIFSWVHCLDYFFCATELLALGKNFPNVVAWRERCMQRPAVVRGLKVCPWVWVWPRPVQT